MVRALTNNLTRDLTRNLTSSAAPSKFTSFSPKKNLKTISFEKLADIIVKTNAREKIENNKKYIYVEIGDIDVNTGGIDYRELFGIRVPKKCKNVGNSSWSYKN